MLLFIFSFSDLDGKYELPLLKSFQLLLQMSVLLDFTEEKKIFLSGKQFVDQVDNRARQLLLATEAGSLQVTAVREMAAFKKEEKMEN